MKTPLIPEIIVTDTPARLGVCNCCGHEAEKREDAADNVKHIKFHWRDPQAKQLAGGSAVGLCRDCRRKAAIALIESL
jgi:uncharacterized Zn ribbon protein